MNSIKRNHQDIFLKDFSALINNTNKRKKLNKDNEQKEIEINRLKEEVNHISGKLQKNEKRLEDLEEKWMEARELINILTENIALTNRERERKDRVNRIKGEMVNNNSSITTCVSTLSLATDTEINVINDGMNDQIKDQGETQVKLIRNQEEHTKQQRKEYMQGEFKRLEATKWPQATEFTTHAEFVQVTKNLTKKLIKKGHPEELIAEALDNSLNASKNTSKYMAISLGYDTNTIKGVIDALEACDIAYTRTTSEERFNSIKRHPREDWEGYIARCSNLYDEMGNGDPNHSKARLRRIKEQFFKGANIERSYADKFMGMNDLDSIVARVIKDEEEGEITYKECGGTEREAYADFRQGNVHPAGYVFSKRTGKERPKGWKPRDTSPDERPKGWERDGMIWMPIYTVEGQEEAETNNEEKKPLYRMKRAPPGTKRAPNERENEGPTDFCRRCRQGDHVAEDCTFRRYCGYCEEQYGDGEVGHTNGTHIQGKERSQTSNRR